MFSTFMGFSLIGLDYYKYGTNFPNPPFGYQGQQNWATEGIEHPGGGE
jgi:hypothetical protein